jgi:hypothetical protein
VPPVFRRVSEERRECCEEHYSGDYYEENGFAGNGHIFGLVSATITANAASPTGVKEFFVSGTWTAPTGVSHVLVTMWGAGGGGRQNATPAPCNIWGGGGGGGAYTSTVVAVTAGTTYTIAVGKGGTAGVNASENGSNGGSSRFSLGTTVLVRAGGGKGGTGATASASGTAGAGGEADGTAQISHAGGIGTFIDSQSNSFVGGDGYGANLAPELPVSLSTKIMLVQYRLKRFAEGGLGNDCSGDGTPFNGNPGYVLLSF